MKLYFEDELQNFYLFEVEDLTLSISSTDDKATEHVFQEAKTLSIFLGKEIEKLMLSGFSQRIFPEERKKPKAVVRAYFPALFINELQESFGVEKRSKPISLGHKNKSTLENKLPESLNLYLQLREHYSFGDFTFGDLQIVEDEINLSVNMNRFEHEILADQNDLHSQKIALNFMGGYFIGDTKDSKHAYIAVPHELEPQRAEIWMFEYERAMPLNAIFDDLSTLFFVNNLIEELYYGGDLKAVSKVHQQLIDRCTVPSLSKKTGVNTQYISNSQNQVSYYFNRSYWITNLLRNDADISLSDIAEMFHPDLHIPQRWEKTKAFRFIQTNPITQYYWLWRLFWFNQNAQLRECIELVKNSPSLLVCDAALLIEELQNGRKVLGTIKDIHARREAWLAFELDPSLSEEHLVSAADKAKKMEMDLAMAHAQIGELDDNALYKMSWDYLDNENVLPVWLEHLRHAGEISDERMQRLEGASLHLNT